MANLINSKIILCSIFLGTSLFSSEKDLEIKQPSLTQNKKLKELKARSRNCPSILGKIQNKYPKTAGQIEEYTRYDHQLCLVAKKKITGLTEEEYAYGNKWAYFYDLVYPGYSSRDYSFPPELTNKDSSIAVGALKEELKKTQMSSFSPMSRLTTLFYWPFIKFGRHNALSRQALVRYYVAQENCERFPGANRVATIVIGGLGGLFFAGLAIGALAPAS